MHFSTLGQAHGTDPYAVLPANLYVKVTELTHRHTDTPLRKEIVFNFQIITKLLHKPQILIIPQTLH